MSGTLSRVAGVAALLCGCAVQAVSALPAYGSGFVISVQDQELAAWSRGKVVARFPVSTSKFGTGDGVGTYRTPLGTFFVSAKIGDGLASGAVIKSRAATGELVAANSVSRDADCLARALVARQGCGQSKCLRTVHLHPRHPGGKADWTTRQFRLRSDAI